MPWRKRGAEPFATRGLGVAGLRDLRDRVADEVVAAALADQPVAPAVGVLRLVDATLAAREEAPSVRRRQRIAAERTPPSRL